MHGIIPADAQRAIFPADSSDSEKSFSDSSVTGFEFKWFSRLCEWLWRDKPAAALDHLTSAKLPQCYRYASGRQEPPATLIVELLRGPDGERFLDAVMRGSKVKWFADLCRARAIAAGVDRAVEQYELGLE